MAFYFHRLAIHKLPNAEVIVSAFLPLATCGQGSSGIIQIGKVGKTVFMDTKFAGVPNGGDIILVISTVVGLMLWGLGLWWFIHGITSVLKRMLTARLRFNMGFWGFVFPLGVFVAATTALSHSIPSGFFSILSEVLLVLLSCLYIIVTLYTVFGIFGLFRQEKLLIAPCMSDSPVQCSTRSHVFAIQATCCNQFAVQASSVALSIHRCMLLCITGVFAMHARLLSACRPK